MVASAQLRGQPDTAILTLCGVHEPQHIFSSLTPEAGGVLRAEPAPFGADAGLHRAQRLAVGMARDQARLAEIAPHRGQIFLPDAQQVDALSAGHLHGRDAELFRHDGDGVQFGGRGQAAPHARHHAVGAVLLDIGVHALVDEARAGIVAIFAGPGAQQIIIQRRAALVAALRLLPAEILRAPRPWFSSFARQNALADFVMAGVGAFAHRLLGGLGVDAGREGEQRLNLARALSARGGGLGMGAHLGERGEFLVADGTNDGALGDAVAAADLGIVRHRGDIGGGRLAGDRFRDGAAEHQPFAQGTHVLVLAHQLQIPGPSATSP